MITIENDSKIPLAFSGVVFASSVCALILMPQALLFITAIKVSLAALTAFTYCILVTSLDADETNNPILKTNVLKMIGVAMPSAIAVAVSVMFVSVLSATKIGLGVLFITYVFYLGCQMMKQSEKIKERKLALDENTGLLHKVLAFFEEVNLAHASLKEKSEQAKQGTQFIKQKWCHLFNAGQDEGSNKPRDFETSSVIEELNEVCDALSLEKEKFPELPKNPTVDEIYENSSQIRLFIDNMRPLQERYFEIQHGLSDQLIDVIDKLDAVKLPTC